MPVALTTYVFFGVGAFYAARYLLRRDPRRTISRATSALHVGIIFGTLVLLTGADLGEDLVGPLVELVGRAAERLPDSLPFL